MKLDRIAFIKRLFVIALPIIVQQLLLNMASLLDTLMVGQLNDEAISGVYIATQIIFVINLMIVGSIEGGSVFLCQFKGANAKDDITKSFVFKMYFSLFVSIIATLICFMFSKQLVSLFSKDEAVIDIANKYLLVVATSFIPFAITNAISTSMRELDHPYLSMLITFIAILFNVLLNYLFIYGKCGFIKLGPTGAAVGTIFERYLEVVVLIILCTIKKYNFTYRLKKNLKIEAPLLKKYIIKSTPLLINETLWALGQSVLVYFFSQVDSIATVVLPISTTICNLAFVVCIGLGNSISIIIGETVGSKEYDLAQKQCYLSLACSFVIGISLGLILIIIAPLVVSCYKVDPQAREYAEILIRYQGILFVVYALNNALFFMMRSRGRTEIVLVFDSFYAYLIQVPLCFILLKFTNLSFIPYVMIIYGLDAIKIIIGSFIVISKKWIKNLTIN